LRAGLIHLACVTLWAAWTSTAWSGIATAQSYPSKPVHIVVPFAAGGITDILARALALRLTETFAQQVVVENKPGATGQVGAEAVAKAAPDGYTLLVAADATFVTNPHFYSKLAYDALNDFAPITGLGISPQALVVNPALPRYATSPISSSLRGRSPARSTTAPSASARAGISTSSFWAR